MRLLGILVLSLLVGCAARPSMQELEDEAAMTGDWRAVAKRKQMDRKMGRVQSVEECANGYVYFCETKSAQEQCGCVSPLDRKVLR